ncbi:MAG: hypothetical protein WD272_06190 [Balneolales bacterium]
MNTRNMISTIHLHLLTTALLMLVVSGCDYLGSNTTEEITDEELEMAGQIIASSLSDDGGGVLATLYDAVSEVEETGIRYDRPVLDDEAAPRYEPYRDGKHGHNGGPGREHRPGHESDTTRGPESGFEAHYNPDTGEHTVRFVRQFEGPFRSKSLKVHYVYIYTDIEGAFLQFPRRQQDLIETIDFKGIREGSISTEARSNTFFRADTLFLDGVSSATPILTLEGTHYGNGEMEVHLERLNRLTNRSYEVFFEMQDIRMDKEVVRESGSLEDGITGFINYRLHMSATINGELRERELSGVIELAGDGTALLRFEKVQQFFRIALGDGTVTRSDHHNAGPARSRAKR